MGRKLDITDQIFGRLQAIVIDWYKTKQTGRTHWFCQCECGNIVSVNITSLRGGNSKSCGCLHKEIVSEKCKNSREDLTGQLFDRWFVDSYNSEKSKEKGESYYDCICINDGNKSCVSTGNLKSGKSKSCGCLQKEIASKNMQKTGKKNSGENNPNWKDGITSLYMQIRNSLNSKEFVQSILKKVKYTCQLTGEIGGDLQVHHKKGFAKILEENNITTKEQAFECKELWDENNVIVLSEKWHKGVKTYNPNAFHRLYGTQNFTEEDFYEWFEEFSITENKVFDNFEK